MSDSTKTLLAELVYGNSQEEVYATRGIHYLIENARIREKFIGFLEQKFNIQINKGLYFINEHDLGESGRPDIVGKFNSKAHLIIEAKFDASLTDNQPKNYIRELEKSGGCLCLVIAPKRRFPTLWDELKRRALGDDWTIKSETGFELCFNENGIKLALISWDYLLRSLETLASDEPQIVADINQLLGLCNKIDERAFIPFVDNDLDCSRGRKYQQLTQLITELRDKLYRENVCTWWKGKNDSPGWRPLCIGKFNAYISFREEIWTESYPTPIYLTIGKTLGDFEGIKNKYKENPKLGATLGLANFNVPLFVKTGVEKPHLLDDLVEQVKKIKSDLESIPPTSTES